MIFFSLNLFSQFVVDAGKDTTICASLYFTEAKLENVTVSNGEAPYTIKWECNVEYSVNSKLTASDLLKDTTVLTPTIIKPLKDYSNKWILFTVEVTDKNGNQAKDSLKVRFSSYKYLMGYTVKEINRGDSILLQGSSVIGGIAPVSYHWQPEEYLEHPNSLTTWAKPVERTSYGIVLTDSCGCVSEPNLVCEIRVRPSKIEDDINANSRKLKIRQINNKICFNNPLREEAIISVYAVNGILKAQTKTVDDNLNISNLLLSKKGVYIIMISVGTRHESLKITI